MVPPIIVNRIFFRLTNSDVIYYSFIMDVFALIVGFRHSYRSKTDEAAGNLHLSNLHIIPQLM